MSESAVLEAVRRAETGTRAVRKLREQGRVPGVLYGHKEEVVPISLDTAVLEAALRRGAHGLLELSLDGKTESTVIKDLQWDVFGREILHVDFARVSRDEKIEVEIPIVVKGIAPGVAEGGVLDQPLHSIEIRCSAGNVKENVVVNISQLHLGQAILVKDLTLGEGAEALADPEQIVLQVIQQSTEEEAVGGEAPAEPELIRREKEEEGQEKE